MGLCGRVQVRGSSRVGALQEDEAPQGREAWSLWLMGEVSELVIWKVERVWGMTGCRVWLWVWVSGLGCGQELLATRSSGLMTSPEAEVTLDGLGGGQ